MNILDRIMEQLAELKRAKKEVGSLESKLKKAKLALATTDQLKADLAAAEQAQDASYVAITQAQSEAAIAKAQRDKALQDLSSFKQ